MILHESLTTSSPSTNQPNCHIQNRKKVLQKKSWNNPEEKLTIYQNHSTLVWSEHRSALGNIFSDPNFQPFFSRDIFLCVRKYSKSCDADFFWGKFGESKVSSPLCHLFRVPQWICASVNIVFVRCKSLYFRQQVPSFLRQWHISEFSAPYPRSLQRRIHNGWTSNGSWENRKATQSTVPRCPPWVAKQRPGTTKSSSS